MHNAALTGTVAIHDAHDTTLFSFLDERPPTAYLAECTATMASVSWYNHGQKFVVVCVTALCACAIHHFANRSGSTGTKICGPGLVEESEVPDTQTITQKDKLRKTDQ